MSLSKNLMQMKFMKKSRDKEEEEAEMETGSLLDQDLTQTVKTEGSKYIIESSYVPCEQLMFGRRSYKGMNPEIELIMANEESNQMDTTPQEVDISNKEMVQRLRKNRNN